MNSRATLVSPISVPLYTVISVYTEIYRRSSEGGKGKVAPPPPRISGGPREGEAMTGRRTRSSIPFVQLGATSSRGTRSAQAFSRERSPAAAAKRVRRAPQTDAAAPAPCAEGWLLPGRAPVRATRVCSNHVFVLMRLFSDVQQLDVEDQGGIWRNHTTGSASSIAELRRNSQLPFTSNFHSCYSFIPALDHPAASQWK